MISYKILTLVLMIEAPLFAMLLVRRAEYERSQELKARKVSRRVYS